MRKQRTQYLGSTILSVLLHMLLFLIVAITLQTCASPVSVSTDAVTPSPSIEAEVVTQQEVNQYYERQQAKALAQERKLQLEKEKRELATRRAAEKKRAELLRQQKLEAEKQKQAEQERLERERLEKEQQQQAELRRQEQRKRAEEQKREAEKKRLAEEQRKLAEQKRLEAEQLKMRKQQIAIWERQYKSMIRNGVERHWKKPPASVKGGECVLKLRQRENGTIVDVKLINCSGDKLFVRSVEEAVWKANPLPLAPSAEVFDAEIEFTFRRDY